MEDIELIGSVDIGRVTRLASAECPDAVEAPSALSLTSPPETALALLSSPKKLPRTGPTDQPYLRPLILQVTSGDKAAFLGFLLDPTTHHSVIALTQTHGDLVTEHVCHLTRSWLYIHHRARFRALDLWEALI